ncbi:MAG: hypothetical protein ACK5N6_02195, partial [Microcystis sp.]|uniref:hypothetical protein n=1 Tax=Microcystis sp. TaxID=1127 RepID=UPI00391CB6BD
ELRSPTGNNRPTGNYRPTRFLGIWGEFGLFGRKLCAPTVTDFVHNVGANCVRPKGTLSKRKSLILNPVIKD